MKRRFLWSAGILITCIMLSAMISCNQISGTAGETDSSDQSTSQTAEENTDASDSSEESDSASTEEETQTEDESSSDTTDNQESSTGTDSATQDDTETVSEEEEDPSETEDTETVSEGDGDQSGTETTETVDQSDTEETTDSDDGTVVSSEDFLMITEYFEGTGYNKYVELFNCSSDDVDLSQYSIVEYTGGSDTENSIELSGTLAPGKCVVYFYSKTDLETITSLNILSDVESDSDGWKVSTNKKALGFNGDDAVELQYNGTAVDLIGTKDGTDFGEDAAFVRKPGMQPSSVYAESDWTITDVTDENETEASSGAGTYTDE